MITTQNYDEMESVLRAKKEIEDLGYQIKNFLGQFNLQDSNGTSIYKAGDLLVLLAYARGYASAVKDMNSIVRKIEESEKNGVVRRYQALHCGDNGFKSPDRVESWIACQSSPKDWSVAVLEYPKKRKDVTP